MEGTVRRYSQEEEEKLLKKIVENNEVIIKLQKQLGELQVGGTTKNNETEGGGRSKKS